MPVVSHTLVISVCTNFSNNLTNRLYIDGDGYRVDEGFYAGNYTYISLAGRTLSVTEISGRFCEIVPNRLQFYGDRPNDDTIYLLDFFGEY